MKPSTFNLQNRGTIGKSVGKLKMNDSMSDFIVCRAHDYVLYFRFVFILVPKVNWFLPIEILANPGQSEKKQEDCLEKGHIYFLDFYLITAIVAATKLADMT